MATFIRDCNPVPVSGISAGEIVFVHVNDPKAPKPEMVTAETTQTEGWDVAVVSEGGSFVVLKVFPVG